MKTNNTPNNITSSTLETKVHLIVANSPISMEINVLQGHTSSKEQQSYQELLIVKQTTNFQRNIMLL